MFFQLTTEDKTNSTFLYFKIMVEKHFSLFVKMIQIDGGTKFKSLVTSLEKKGVVHNYTCLHTFEHNCVV